MFKAPYNSLPSTATAQQRTAAACRGLLVIKSGVSNLDSGIPKLEVVCCMQLTALCACVQSLEVVACYCTIGCVVIANSPFDCKNLLC